MSKIIIIEDEKCIAESLKMILEEHSLHVTIYKEGLEGLKHWQDFDLLVLDLMLPDCSGLDILKQIRLVSPTFPVIIASAKSTEEDIIAGLSLGADDYVTKPFSIQELTLRIKRALSRKELLQQDNEFRFGKGNTINFSNFSAQTSKGAIKLTTQETELLQLLIEKKEQLISRKDLLEKIWGRSDQIESRTVDNFIVRFRKYFEIDPKKPKHFITKRGVGYIFQP